MSTHLPRLLAITLLFACAATHAGGLQLPGRVLRVIDGDSLVLDVRGSQYQVELAGIDAPELDQPWGPVAAERLYTLLTGAFIVVDAAGTVGYQPVIGSVVFSGRDVALGQLYDGLAWSTSGAGPQSPHANNTYADAQAQARAARRGLWSDEHPIPPWEWRRPNPRDMP